MVSLHCNSSIEHKVTLFIKHMQDEMQQMKNILSKIICYARLNRTVKLQEPRLVICQESGICFGLFRKKNVYLCYKRFRNESNCIVG